MNQKRAATETEESKRGSPEERQQQIIEAAIRCFQRKGYEKTTVDDIAAEYGLSKGSIYWYYPSKKDILIAVFEHMISDLMKGYESQILADIPPKQKVINTLRLFLNMLLKNYETCRPFVVLMAAAYEDDDLAKMGTEIYQQAEQQIVKMLEQVEASGKFVIPNKKMMAQIAIAAGEGLLTRQILAKDLDIDEIERELEAVVEAFLGISE